MGALLLLCFSLNAANASPTNLESYFNALKNLEFSEAKTIANTYPDTTFRTYLAMLVEVLRQQKKIYSTIDLLENDTDDVKIVKFLTMGYQELLSNNQTSIQAYTNFSKALNLAEQLDKNYLKKACLIALLDLLKHEIFIGSKQFDPYLKYFKEIKEDDTDEIMLIFYEIIFYSKGGENLDIDYNYYSSIDKLDRIFMSLPKTHRYYPYYYHEKGIQYKLSKEYDLSKKFFLKTDSTCKNRPSLRKLYGTNLWQLSDLLQLSGNYSESIRYLKKSRTTAENLRDVFYDDRLSSRIFSQIGVYDSAFYYLKKSVDLEYRLGFKNNTLESSIMAVQNETDKLKVDKLRLDAKNKANQNLLISAFLLLIFGGFIAFLLQKNTSKKRKLAEQQEEIQKQKVETLLKEQELTNIDAMIAGQEKERHRVANELHDDLGSLMATIKLHFNNIEITKEDTALKKADQLLEQAYQKVRGIAHAKNSGVIANQGLVPAVQRMAKTISGTNKIKLEVHHFGLEERMENSLELSIFRMIQELVTNTIKHAEATKGSIQLTQHEQSLNILIEDNGKGFDTSKIATTDTGMGLHTIEKRIEHLEGNFTVDSILGKGTSIIIDIPI